MTLILKIDSEHALADFAASWVVHLKPGDLIFLNGDLGAGKTTLTRACLRALGYQGVVKSPTYAMVESYSFADRLLHHFDLYRVRSEEELYAMGIEDYFSNEAICMIEWPCHGVNVLPKPDLILTLNILSITTREIQIDCGSERGKQILTEVMKNKEKQ